MFATVDFPHAIPPVRPTTGFIAASIEDRLRRARGFALCYADRMRAVVQRVSGASVTVEGERVGGIERGLLVFLGAAHGDEAKDVEYIAEKISGLRVFPNDDGRMSLSVGDVEGAVLVVSQFTLFGDVRRGRRPSFDGAADPENAERLYMDLVRRLRDKGLPVETGTFRAMMLVQSTVDGPVTIQIDSRKLY
jgi:D-tyrosyl-tRNA(Tyr) deacylase